MMNALGRPDRQIADLIYSLPLATEHDAQRINCRGNDDVVVLDRAGLTQWPPMGKRRTWVKAQPAAWHPASWRGWRQCRIDRSLDGPRAKAHAQGTVLV